MFGRITGEYGRKEKTSPAKADSAGEVITKRGSIFSFNRSKKTSGASTVTTASTESTATPDAAVAATAESTVVDEPTTVAPQVGVDATEEAQLHEAMSALTKVAVENQAAAPASEMVPAAVMAPAASKSTAAEAAMAEKVQARLSASAVDMRSSSAIVPAPWWHGPVGCVKDACMRMICIEVRAP